MTTTQTPSAPVRHFVFSRKVVKRTACGAKLNDHCVSTYLNVTCKKCQRILNGRQLSRLKYKGVL
jgi:hypothetical protein